MKTAAIVVDFGRPADTNAALHSLAAMMPAPDALIRIDNGSAEVGVKPLSDSVPEGTILIDLPANIGWPGAVNAGMDLALSKGAEWTLVLNNDAVVAPTCLARCLEEASRHPRVAAVGPAIAFDRPRDLLWYAGGQINPWLAFTRHRGLLQASASPPPSSTTAFVTGCCVAFSSDAWRQLGPLRADYFAYYEDAEWCQRAAANGWQCRYVGEVLCWHKVSSSFNRAGSLLLSADMAYYLARNPLRFALETKRALRRLTRALGILVVWNAYNAWRLIRTRDGRVATAYLQGLGDAIKGKMGRRRSVSLANT